LHRLRKSQSEVILSAFAPSNRLLIYALANVAFMLLAGLAAVIGGSPNPPFVYLVLLFALCSSPINYLDRLNGRYSLLSIFLAAYFLLMGSGKLSQMLAGTASEKSHAILSASDIAVLTGGLLLVMSYRWIVSLHSRAVPGANARDWSRSAVLLGGAIMWAIGTYATYEWYVHIVTDSTNDAVRKGLQSAGVWNVSISILAQMMQPLGILMIAYAWRTYRMPILFFAVMAIVTLQVALGFVADAKGLAMMGGILVIISIVLIDARIPKLWLVGAVVYATLVFPIFQAYRTEIHGNRGIARTAVVENFGKILALTLSAEERVNTGAHRAQTLLERSSGIGSVEMIFEKAGNGVPFQHGYTLTPLLATFIPKVVWPDKPDVPTGQLVNKEFHVTDGDDVYISPTTLGELYWNFGWPGVIVGMSIIGALLGWVGSRFNMGDATTVTRLLVTVVTIREIVMGFEGVIAASYVVWLRSLAGIGLLHVMFARVDAHRKEREIVRPEASTNPRFLRDPMPRGEVMGNKPFPNLLT
jgi:hypothetical protein